jgi:hypothetical protein
MRLLRAVDRIATPWKNGGGVTCEILAWPEGAGFEDFDWRVSMAEVAASGPFSRFAEVDRVLVVLDGRLRLTVEGLPSFDLSLDSPPAAFPGDAPAYAELLEGPVLDLNLMTRRGRALARLERLDHGQLEGGPALAIALEAGTVGAVALSVHDAVLLKVGDRPQQIAGSLLVARFA